MKKLLLASAIFFSFNLYAEDSKTVIGVQQKNQAEKQYKEYFTDMNEILATVENKNAIEAAFYAIKNYQAEEQKAQGIGEFHLKLQPSEKVNINLQDIVLAFADDIDYSDELAHSGKVAIIKSKLSLKPEITYKKPDKNSEELVKLLVSGINDFLQNNVRNEWTIFADGGIEKTLKIDEIEKNLKGDNALKIGGIDAKFKFNGVKNALFPFDLEYKSGEIIFLPKNPEYKFILSAIDAKAQRKENGEFSATVLPFKLEASSPRVKLLLNVGEVKENSKFDAYDKESASYLGKRNIEVKDFKLNRSDWRKTIALHGLQFSGEKSKTDDFLNIRQVYKISPKSHLLKDFLAVDKVEINELETEVLAQGLSKDLLQIFDDVKNNKVQSEIALFEEIIKSFAKSKGKFELKSNIKTDKGEFILKANLSVKKDAKIFNEKERKILAGKKAQEVLAVLSDKFEFSADVQIAKTLIEALNLVEKLQAEAQEFIVEKDGNYEFKVELDKQLKINGKDLLNKKK
ncbi:MAG: hypothetical protein IJ566_07960 [Cardiobacteriaceae bacterium]|nr:hypothetical protein [Cardiobacteriaceae bacterium]